MLVISLQDRVKSDVIRKKSKVIDIVDYVGRLKWRWAGHVARMKDNRWTKRCGNQG